jgi:predicted SnoaL-like aldol condensation-catalyzing enzyme
MSEANKSIVRRWFDEVWNAGRVATISELFPASGVARGLGESDTDVHGPAEFEVFAANLRGIVPDIHIDIEDMIAEGDRVAVRIGLQGTHTDGGRVSVRGIIILRVVDGWIVEAWNSYDQLGFLRQIGALPGAGDRDAFLSATQG